MLTIERLLKRGYITTTNYRADLLITNRIEDLEPLKRSCSLDAITIFVCMGGNVHCTVNSQHYHISGNMILVIFAGDVIKIESATDLEGYAALMSTSYLNELDLDFSKRADFFSKVRGHSLVSVSEADIDLMRPFYYLSRYCIEQRCSEIDMIIKGLVTAFCHAAFGIITSNLPETSQYDTHLRGKKVFDRFISLLTQYHCRERTVAFYAAHMAMTPKHLSYAVKEYSGRTALDWINEYVMLEAKSMLRDSAMSIKEIADSLNFISQSAFGKYFRQQLGISPNAYRKSSLLHQGGG